MLEKFKIGHYTNEDTGTGCTVIICEDGAVGGCCTRGSAPATRETDLLKNGKTVQKINAVTLSGGSAFGLECSCGVVQYLHEKNIGYDTKAFKVPIVCSASLYDLEFNKFDYPNKQAGYSAAQNSVANNFIGGNIGAGTGCTISKVLGSEYSVKGGLGIQKFSLNNLEIAVITAVNAVGDIIKDGKIIAGCKGEDGEFMDCQKIMSLGSTNLNNTNTTIGCILTNAKLTKEQANILCELSHDGFARAISPSHTPFDGDTMFLMASGEVEVSFNMLTAIIPIVTEQAIQNSVSDNASITKKISGLVYKAMKKMFK